LESDILIIYRLTSLSEQPDEAADEQDAKANEAEGDHLLLASEPLHLLELYLLLGAEGLQATTDEVKLHLAELVQLIHEGLSIAVPLV
jgi:hypothetical protein